MDQHINSGCKYGVRQKYVRDEYSEIEQRISIFYLLIANDDFHFGMVNNIINPGLSEYELDNLRRSNGVVPPENNYRESILRKLKSEDDPELQKASIIIFFL